MAARLDAGNGPRLTAAADVRGRRPRPAVFPELIATASANPPFEVPSAIEICDFTLVDWQRAAVDRWLAGSGGTPCRGTLEIFTGGGKTLIALASAAAVARVAPNVRLAIVVPSQALALQWIEAVARYTTIPRADIGLLGAGKTQSLAAHRVLVAVINSAALKLPAMAAAQNDPVMLIVDECHRAGADTFARVLGTSARYTLGLSATPARDEVDDDGEPLRYDEQAVARALGPLVYRFGLKEARQIGWLPDYEIHHHGVGLDPGERRRYDELTREVDDVEKRLERLGHDARRARQLLGRGDAIGSAARAYVAVTGKRKDLLYRAVARNAVAVAVVRATLDDDARRRAILFHERVAEVDDLGRRLQAALPGVPVAVEHSQLPSDARREALDRFRSGDARVLVSVKSLVEGIDVPEADVGVSVASSASVRQRVQSLGRVLRRSFAGAAKHAVMHVLYVTDTVDEGIYAKEDWSDMTGAAHNFYWRWTRGERVAEAGPPREPQPGEDAIWTAFGGVLPPLPAAWPGMPDGREYSVDTRGRVRNVANAAIANPQGVAGMVAGIRGRPGGRFRITPKHGLVLVSRHDGTSLSWHLAGRLAQPFEVQPARTDAGDAPADRRTSDALEDRRAGDASTSHRALDGASRTSTAACGAPLRGPADAKNGTYRLRQRAGGVIEKRDGKAVLRAIVADDSGPGGRVDAVAVANARRLLAAWRSLDLCGMKFFVNAAGDAWYRDGAEARFLAHAGGGFAWRPVPEDAG